MCICPSCYTALPQWDGDTMQFNTKVVKVIRVSIIVLGKVTKRE